MDSRSWRQYSTCVALRLPEVWAFRCYSTGAARACITLTWVAVCADLMEKFSRLAEEGEGDAVPLDRRIRQARGRTDAQAIQTMQEIERTILDEAEKLDLMDPIEKRDLERLREDRNLCAHPSLRPLGEFHDPSLQYARTHLAAALDSLLTHPPSQGRKALDRFRTHVIDPYFTGDSSYLTHAFFDSVKVTTRRRIIDLAVKHAVLELGEVPNPPGARMLADRMAACVVAFAVRDRNLVFEAMKKAAERLRDIPADAMIRTIGRLGQLDIFWQSVGEPMRGLFGSLIAVIPDPAFRGQIDYDNAMVLSLASIESVVDLVPQLKARFDRLSTGHKAYVIGHRPNGHFASLAPQLLRDAASWRKPSTSRALRSFRVAGFSP